MKKIIQTKPNCLYVFQGRSCSNSEIVRNLQGAKEFIQSANLRFSGYLKIHSYAIAQDTWTMLVEIEDEDKIKSRYKNSRKRSKKANIEFEYTEIWRMVSDCLRHWLSRFVKWTNFRDKREGSLRLRRYERFYFEDILEAQEYMKNMIEQRVRIPQKNKRFRPIRKKWVLRKVGIGHIYLSIKNVTKEKVLDEFGKGCIRIEELVHDVLRKLLFSTLKAHSFAQIPILNPKNE